GVAADVSADHLDPVGPIVTPAVPYAKLVGNMLRIEEAGQVLVVAARGVVAADGENGIEPAESREPIVVVLMREEVAGVVEVDRVIGPAACHLLEVVQSAESDGAAHQPGVAKREID